MEGGCRGRSKEGANTIPRCQRRLCRRVGTGAGHNLGGLRLEEVIATTGKALSKDKGGLFVPLKSLILWPGVLEVLRSLW